MSLINKMLQDLDARGTPDGRGDAAGIRSVPERERSVSRALAFGGAAGLTAAAIALGWVYLKRPPVPPVLVSVANIPALVPAPVPVPVAATPTPALAAPAAPVVAAKPEPVLQAEEAVPAPTKARAAALRRTTEKPARSAAAPAMKTAVPAASERMLDGKQITPQQRVENEYRRALAQLQDGRVSDAMLALQQTLQLDPRHQGARETLVRLLLEAQRPDDAARQLQLSLALDPKQPAQAMMLARLQLDKANGPAALDTLMRSLPHASDNGDYRAFLAGVLQREQRHREAAEQYQLALQTAPDNSVWWMGLGIAQQADNHPAQARQAFERAKGLQTLSPQLQAFVERKLVQLTAATAK